MAGSTIEFAGRVSCDDLPALYANCRAFVFAADEDFGIAPVEAQSFGIPVIAYGHGGVWKQCLPENRRMLRESSFPGRLSMYGERYFFWTSR